MKLLFAVATIVLAVWIESGSAIQCVKCTSNPGQITPGCDDPFDPLITTTDTCEGRCLATKSTSMTLVEVSRSCVVPDPAAGQDCPAAAFACNKKLQLYADIVAMRTRAILPDSKRWRMQWSHSLVGLVLL